MTASPRRWGSCCLVAILIRKHYVSLSPSRVSGSLLRKLMAWLRLRRSAVPDLPSERVSPLNTLKSFFLSFSPYLLLPLYLSFLYLPVTIRVHDPLYCELRTQHDARYARGASMASKALAWDFMSLYAEHCSPPGASCSTYLLLYSYTCDRSPY